VEITWFGHACFRLKGKDAMLITDPTGRKSAGRDRLVAEIVTVSHQHEGHNQVDSIGGTPRILTGPGEYEVKGVGIRGVGTYHDSDRGKKRGKNTAFVVEIDDLVICHLGDLGHIPTADQLSHLRNVDVLLVPVGGEVTIDSAQAVEVISLIEPHIVIPMHCRVGDLDPELEPVDRFLREMGVTTSEPQPKLTVTKSTVPDGQQVIVLDPRVGTAA
jgi:L-ascorbate metabolism protein UlaG (beta-lactamase superfamily)